MPEIIHRLPAVKKIVGLSRSSIYALIKQDDFPKPIHLGGRSVGWLDSEIREWIQKRIASRDKNNLKP
jgi:prophage regulatory protein